MAFDQDARISISKLAPWKIASFIRLKNKLESETTHLPGSRERTFLSVVYDLLRMIVNRKRVLTFVARAGKENVGFITIIFARWSKFRGNSYISNLSVSKEMQNQGIGTMLIQKAEECARSRGVKRLELETFSRNDKALRLYKKLGFVIEGTKKNAVRSDNGFDDVVFMAKYL